MTSSNINKVNVSGSIINKVNVSSSISASSARGLTKLPESITAYVKITIGTIIPEGTKIIHPNVGLPQKLEEPLKVSLPDKFEAYLPAKTQIGQKNSDVLFELKEKFLVQILIKE